MSKLRCKDLCRDEAPLEGSGNGRYNAKCRHCHKALNTNELRCYCCGQKLSRRVSLNSNLQRIEAMVTRI